MVTRLLASSKQATNGILENNFPSKNAHRTTPNPHQSYLFRVTADPIGVMYDNDPISFTCCTFSVVIECMVAL
jgi:hypothetical protein